MHVILHDISTSRCGCPLTELEAPRYWGSPHPFRKSVATLISERVDAETASQQLGYSSPAITREFYISKPAIAANVAHVLDELAEIDPEGGPNTGLG